MTQKDKELLLKDLSARLPYGVKVKTYIQEPYTLKGLFETEYNGIVGCLLSKHPYKDKSPKTTSYPLSEFKPYLFPISSMTEEQKKEYEAALTYHDYVEGGWTIAKSFDNEYIIPYWFVDFCNKNHFDYRGLIEKGLAIDATGLKIY